MAKGKQQKRDLAGAKAASSKMKRKEFEKELAKLQVELTRLQTWVQTTGARIIVVFEGRDTAGKGGVISRITARTSPRVYRHVALPAPSDREKTQIYIQRYIAHFPAAGEIVLFDRSWYNRGWSRAGDALLHGRAVRALPVCDPNRRAGHGRPKRYHSAQVLS